MSLRSLELSPKPINRLRRAGVNVEFVDAPPAADLRISWFGNDGWVVCYQTAELLHGKASFVIPAGSFHFAGKYQYEIDSDAVHLAAGTADVSE